MGGIFMRIKKDFITQSTNILANIAVYCYYFEETPNQALHFMKNAVQFQYNLCKNTDDVAKKYLFGILKGFTLMAKSPEELAFYIETYINKCYNVDIVPILTDTSIDAYTKAKRIDEVIK
jgi:hypothetical protein